MGITIKRGDTLTLQCQYTDANGVPLSLADYAIKSQIRDALDTLIAEFIVTVTDEINGRYTLSLADVDVLPVNKKDVYFDIEYRLNDVVVSTATESILVVKDITHE
jgi:CRISPR/Cas system type I-B associated protein Csh2 (Cas7 group RAMP superfamily)